MDESMDERYEDAEQDFLDYQAAHAARAAIVCTERAHACAENDNYCPYLLPTIGICAIYDM